MVLQESLAQCHKQLFCLYVTLTSEEITLLRVITLHTRWQLPVPKSESRLGLLVNESSDNQHMNENLSSIVLLGR